MNGLRFGVEIHGELIDINKGLPEMYDLIDRFRIVNKRVLGPKVRVGFIDNKSVLYRYDIIPKFQQTNVFIVVENAHFFSLLDFYVVVQHQFTHNGSVCVGTRLNQLRPKTKIGLLVRFYSVFVEVED